MESFNYENTETKIQKGGKIVRKVSIKKGRGYKSVTKYRKGKKLSTIKKPLHKEHIKLIKIGKFIPGLFLDCNYNKTKKRRGGNGIDDIEKGRDTPTNYMKTIPPDPDRFKQYEQQFRSDLSRPIKAEQVMKFYSGPTPEAKEAIERDKMIDEDPLYKDPFDREELKIFSDRGGKRRYRGGDANIQTVDTQRQRKLAELQDLMRQNQEISQRYNEIDNRLYEIEEMTPEVRQQHIDEQNDLERQINELRQLNDQLQQRFEQTRSEYFRQYGTPTIQ